MPKNRLRNVKKRDAYAKLLIQTYYLFAVLVALAVAVAYNELPINVIQKFYYHDNMTSHFFSVRTVLELL